MRGNPKGLDLFTVEQLEKKYKVNFDQCFKLIALPKGDYDSSVVTKALIALRDSEVRKSKCGKFLLAAIRAQSRALR